MKCAIINNYGPASQVFKIESVDTPDIHKDEILIRQHASSVNPIDCKVRDGYGRVMLSKRRGFELPLILGNDVAGEVIKVGSAVKNLDVGDAVYGVCGIKSQGSYAEFVVTSPDHVVHKPESLSFQQAASLPYVACSVWQALVGSAGLTSDNAKAKKVFVQGGAGGIGSFAIQLLKAWGAQVATTCSKADAERVKALGADHIIDYENENYSTMLSGYDVALETVGGPLEDKTLSILRKDGKGSFVTLIHPLLSEFDSAGLVGGGLKVAWQITKRKRYAKKLGLGGYHWAFYKPSKEALDTVNKLFETGKMVPFIDREFQLDEIVSAHEYWEQGKSKGKIVVRIGFH